MTKVLSAAIEVPTGTVSMTPLTRRRPKLVISKDGWTPEGGEATPAQYHADDLAAAPDTTAEAGVGWEADVVVPTTASAVTTPATAKAATPKTAARRA
ncbi:MAG TPA: hypothetical protein VK386_04430 [Acidimicrobiales bacterium]|nr:hypothetical protein [Acidimicrobiales bacterium]